MTIEELLNKITPSVSVVHFDLAFSKLLQIILGDGEEMVTHYHCPGEFTPIDTGFKTKRPETICVLTSNRLHKIDMTIDEDKQFFQTHSYLLTDIASYSVDVATRRETAGLETGTRFTVKTFSLVFSNGEKMELHWEGTRAKKDNDLEEFAKSVLQRIR